MLEFKYYKKIKADQERTATAHPSRLPPFDIEQLGVVRGIFRRTLSRLTNLLLRLILFLLRELWPNARLGRLIIVTRERDVKAVLADPGTFEVPYGLEMPELANRSASGANFVLGLEGPEHDKQNQLIRSVLKREDSASVTEWSKRFSQALIGDAAGSLDVVKDLITRVATETCCRYFGLPANDPDAFAEWAMSISALLFADPFGNEKTRALALNGAARVRNVVDRAIARAKQGRCPNSDTVVERLVAAQRSDSSLTDDQIRAILVGLVTGFIPTNTLAAGKMLEELLRRPAQLERAKLAARNGDKDTLRAILLEAARLNPALAPGQWRYASKDGFIGDTGVKARKDSVLMVATMSALRDRRAFSSPNAFIAERKESPDLLFGEGAHFCLGKYAAMAQITEVFAALLALPNLRRAGAMEWVGPFPRRLEMTFDSAAACQTMAVICAPVRADLSTNALTRLIADVEALGNPAKPGVASALKDTGVVHFASLSVIDSTDDPADQRHHLILELNVDGTQEKAIAAVAEKAAGWLEPIFRRATGEDGASLAELLRKYAVTLHGRPWGATGLNFNGTPEFSVAEIGKEAELADFTEDALDHYLEAHVGLGSRAMTALNYVRSLIRQDQRFARAAKDPHISAAERERLQNLLERGGKLGDLLLRPSGRRLKISTWVEPKGREAFFRFLTSESGRGIVVMGLLFVCAVTAGILVSLGLADASIGFVLIAVVGGITASALIAGAVFGLLLLLLRRHEQNDLVDDQEPDLQHVKTLAASENHRGYAQNHITAVTPLKKGWFRRGTLAIALWGIKQLVTHWYRPGFVLNMGTIHYAKWFRLPGTEKLIFLANYDGSWESYLEDFIMKAHEGQSAAWSNGVGFPRTRFLIYDGAQDGDRFKRWVRRQQRPTQFWYSRHPELTTDQIRRNALIHDGLARATTDTAARAWISCFGSMQRPDYTIETDEVQSLVFRGMRELHYGAYVLAKLPSDAPNRRGWLQQVLTAKQVAFGDRPFDAKVSSTATFIALSAAGLRKFGMPDAAAAAGVGLATFPTVFNIGMANRANVLGDAGASAPQAWRWRDAPIGESTSDESAAEAALILYAASADERDQLVEAQLRTLEDAGGHVLHIVPTNPIVQNGEATTDYEHFGFRDGISQPVIRGTQRFARGALARDIVEPGEFILGYRNNQGYFPPTPVVGAETDAAYNLPLASATEPSRFPTFMTLDSEATVRDFGRNGAFIAIRQLAQDVAGFNNFTKERAAEITARYEGVKDVTGGAVTAEWVAAKIVGRWRDGTSLIERANVGYGGQAAGDTGDNDFSYGVDDPRGLSCPLGAHIRRANPRDSLQPGEAAQQAIVNRHRLLRRGRSYEYKAPTGDIEKGLMFVCVCADLARQFEFVQETWLKSPSFHGLSNEPDPLVTPNGDSTGAGNAERVFTIPTSSGALTLHGMRSFIEVRAGGYFFLPSRSALRYLAAFDLDNVVYGQHSAA